MAQKTLHELFDTFLNRQPHFKTKTALQEAYTPGDVPHRDEQINQLASILVSTLRGDKPSNIFIYGKTGTGKTLVCKYVSQELENKAKQIGGKLKTIYMNCKMEKINTTYRLLARLSQDFGKAVPPTGLPTDEVYKNLVMALNNNKGLVIIILDEVDALTDMDVLYDLTRINTKLNGIQISIIGISNDLSFTDNLDPRIRSSLSEEELVFPPYNAVQLQDILMQRAGIALREDVLDEGVIPKCAALAAQEHGDARRALDLLRVAGEIAERNGDPKVAEEHVDRAQKKLDVDRILEVVKTQPKQSQLVLYSILYLKDLNKEEIATGEVYEVYQTLSKQCNVTPLTQRRVSDLISELDMLGVINATTISKGRYGRTRKIKIAMSSSALEKSRGILQTELL